MKIRISEDKVVSASIQYNKERKQFCLCCLEGIETKEKDYSTFSYIGYDSKNFKFCFSKSRNSKKKQEEYDIIIFDNREKIKNLFVEQKFNEIIALFEVKR